MEKRIYQDNTQPKINDTVVFASDDTNELYKVTSVQGGRLGNKVGVKPSNNLETFSREYYYYCLCPVHSETKFSL